MAQVMTERLRRENANCECAKLRPEVVASGQDPCIKTLRPTQGWYLYELSEVGGAVGFISIGSGKTCLDILSSMVLLRDAKDLAVLMISPTAVAQFLKDFNVWRQHFKVPNLIGHRFPMVVGRPRLEILPYSQLSRPENALWLQQRASQIKLFIGDECQALKDVRSTRGNRYMRFHADVTSPASCYHSGSFTTRQVQDCAHLTGLSLRGGSPLPLDKGVVDEWGDALNPRFADDFLRHSDQGPHKLRQKGETLLQAVHRRLTTTKGVIVTTDTSVEAELQFKEADAGPVPQSILNTIEDVRATEQRPDGWILMDQMEVAVTCATVALGGYCIWRYPRGEPEDLIKRWNDRRKDWAKEVRGELKHRRRDRLDSPSLLREAAERHLQGYKGPLPTWRSDTLEAWKEVEGLVEPEEDFVWIDDYLAKACAKWAQEGVGLVWYKYRAFGTRVSKLAHIPRYGGGPRASRLILEEKGDRSILASIDAHHKEKNLQYAFSRMLFGNPIADGGRMEQAIGRVHRSGQPKPTVEAFFFRHLPEIVQPFEKAREYARYIQGFTGNPQRLLFAKYGWKQGDGAQ